MDEIWKSIPGYPGYEASSYRRVRGLDREVLRIHGGTTVIVKRQGRVLRPSKQRNGYLRVCLCREGQVSPVLVHRAVLTAFVSSCPEGMQAAHDDGDGRIITCRTSPGRRRVPTPPTNTGTAQSWLASGIRTGRATRAAGATRIANGTLTSESTAMAGQLGSAAPARGTAIMKGCGCRPRRTRPYPAGPASASR
jgi:hypothetical protein